jgi:hypothetical protein
MHLRTQSVDAVAGASVRRWRWALVLFLGKLVI